MKNKKMLIIDDEKDLVEIFKFHIEQADYIVDTAIDGQEGIQKLKTNRYNLVITDLRMPGTSGVEIISVAKEADIPIIVSTAYTRELEPNIPSDVPVITKPFNLDVLMKQIDSMI